LVKRDKKNLKNLKKWKKKCQIFSFIVAAKPELKPDPGAGSRCRIWSWFPEPDRDPHCGKLLDMVQIRIRFGFNTEPEAFG
jgi:hypothetical protein